MCSPEEAQRVVEEEMCMHATGKEKNYAVVGGKVQEWVEVVVLNQDTGNSGVWNV